MSEEKEQGFLTVSNENGAALFARNITGEILISDAGMHLGGAPLIAR